MTFAERSFARMLETFPRWGAPASLAPLLSSKRTGQGERWMRRNGIEERDLRSAGYSVLLLGYTISMASLLIVLLLFGPQSGAMALFPALLAPLAAASLFVNAPESLSQGEERRILAESPAVVGGLTMSMQLQPSLERAVLFASRGTHGVLPGRLREAMWSSLTRVQGSVERAVIDMSSAFSSVNDPLRQSLHLIMAATRERTREGMDRLLDKANSIALNGVRDAVDRYVASLSTPTMVLFSLGTLLPIMLFTLLPMLSLGSSFGGDAEAPSSLGGMAALLLIVFPSASFIYARSILRRNPLVPGVPEAVVWRRDLPLFVLMWVVIAASSFVVDLGERQAYLQAASVVLPPCAYLSLNLRSGHSARSRRSRDEKEMVNALFLVGNTMAAGASLEEALRRTALARPGGSFESMARRVLHRATIIGGGMKRALSEDKVLKETSPLVQAAFATVAECSERDPRYAGQVALNLAQLLSDLNACQAKIDEKLKGVVDMMRSTALVFGPVVLGVTSSLFAVIGGAEAVDDIVLLTGIYIAQLSLIVSHFTVFLQGNGSWGEVGYQFATRTPVALLTFAATSLICRTGLISLL